MVRVGLKTDVEVECSGGGEGATDAVRELVGARRGYYRTDRAKVTAAISECWTTVGCLEMKRSCFSRK